MEKKGKKEEGSVVGLLRWPTPPAGMALPVVQCAPDGACLTLLAPSASALVTRALVEADAAGKWSVRDGIRAALAPERAGEADKIDGGGGGGAGSYADGDAEKSGLGVERFLIARVAGFADVYEGLARFHLAKGDAQSALVTCEASARAQGGWGRAHAFHAGMLRELGRATEARDAARFALQLPLWTLPEAGALADMGAMAGYQDAASLGRIYRRLYEDGRAEEIAGGKPPQQVALDRAAWLLDVCVAEGGGAVQGGWAEVREALAGLYDEAEMHDFATFVRY